MEVKLRMVSLVDFSLDRLSEKPVYKCFTGVSWEELWTQAGYLRARRGFGVDRERSRGSFLSGFPRPVFRSLLARACDFQMGIYPDIPKYWDHTQMITKERFSLAQNHKYKGIRTRRMAYLSLQGSEKWPYFEDLQPNQRLSICTALRIIHYCRHFIG